MLRYVLPTGWTRETLGRGWRPKLGTEGHNHLHYQIDNDKVDYALAVEP